MDVNTNFMGAESTSLVRTPGDVLQTAINVDLMTTVVNGWYDCGPYNTMNIQVIGGATITAGAITFECTNDPTNTAGRPIPYRDAEVTGSSAVSTALTVTSGFNKLYQVVLTGRYFRARISTAFTGAATGARIIAQMEEETASFDLGQQGVLINGTPNVNLSSSTASTAHAATSAATTNATLVKGSGGRVYAIMLSNMNAAARYFKIYNKATAPTVGTDIPVLTIPVPATSVVTIPLNVFGWQLATGIGYAITGAAADSDTTVITAGDFKTNIQYV